MSLTDLYIKDRHTGLVHKVGTNKHDSLWVDSYGTVCYQNLQNGDGCGSASKIDEEAGYEFIPSDCGMKESEDDCPMCGHHMLQLGPDGYLFCVECGEWSDKDGNIIPEQRLLDEGLITETRAETEKRLNAIFNPPKTNYRKIIASPETLAEFISGFSACCDCPADKLCVNYQECYKAMLEWLKQESK